MQYTYVCERGTGRLASRFADFDRQSIIYVTNMSVTLRLRQCSVVKVKYLLSALAREILSN